MKDFVDAAGSDSADVASLPLDVEAAVRGRYSAASRERVASLCCPVQYDARYLAVLPQELIERDYGCGDPSRHVRAGETVLDLGCGGGKVCYIASQVVGPAGRVIGIDFGDDMLALARRFQPEVTRRIGYDNVTFLKGRIQDLALDLAAFENWLTAHPVRTADGWLAAQAEADRLRRAQPLVADAAVDAIVSNCVLNLVRPDDRRQLFAEMFRVLRPGGRATISDITSDEPVPESLRRNAELWSGCISGAFTERGFLAAFEEAGFVGLSILQRQAEPWATVEGIEFRSVTVQAHKLPVATGMDRGHAVIYAGPWRYVTDDAGRTLARGERTAVGDAEFARLTAEPYAGELLPVPPAAGSAAVTDAGPPFDNRRPRVRHPRETKGRDYRATQLPGDECCADGECC
jgi:ubiquinone/menaquinone biosynthesis C-methylase UbiE